MASKNPNQDYITNNIKGIYVVDAGAGTGKTYSITNRYINILNQPFVSCKNILLLTFTNNAASNMKDKIISKIIATGAASDILETNISTFDSFCNKILTTFGENTPSYLGFETKLSSNFQLLDNKILNNKFFKKIYLNFRKKSYNKYKNFFDVVNEDYYVILHLIFKLQSRGIFPTKDFWFLDGYNKLIGSFDLFKKDFDNINKLGVGKRRPTQSLFLKKLLYKMKSHNYFKSEFDINVWKKNKQVDPNIIKSLYFKDDRSKLIDFIHDIYVTYILESIKENKLTFGFLSMFTLVLLYYNKKVREANSFDYVMIDEFQDTNELQFLLFLLLMKKNNLLVVGDWKQGIYSFRNATIDNILDFETKINYYKDILNKDQNRIDFDVTVNKKFFDKNYRSSQKILDFSKYSLLVNGSKSELYSEDQKDKIESNIVKLKASFDLNDYSEIKFLRTNSRDNEINFILFNIIKLIDNKLDNTYKIKELDTNNNYKLRNINLSDIAVLCRNSEFAQDLQSKATEIGLPANYEGGVNLFNKECSIILLAYLKLLGNIHDISSWCTILDYYNFSFNFKKELFSNNELINRKYPSNIFNFVLKLKKLKNINHIVNEIFKFNNIQNKYSNKISSLIYSLFENNLFTINDLIYFIEENIKNNETYNLDILENTNAITIQTIHGSKGLEYPVVFLANINQSQFPSYKSDTNLINYTNKTGIRLNKKVCVSNNYYSDYYDPISDLINTINITDYDEERRLYYVAITRAKQYLFLTSYKPSIFYTELLERSNLEEEYCEEFNLNFNSVTTNKSTEDIIIPKYNKRGLVLSVHDIMNYNLDPNIVGKGIQFGNYIHNCAQKIALGKVVTDIKTPEVNNLRKFISSLNAKELFCEVDCTLPLDGNLIRGNIDLVCDFGNNIYQIIDYKTDTTKLNHEEYVKQLSVYYHCLKGKYKDANIICKIYYITQNKIDVIKPLTINKIKELLENYNN